MKKFIKDTAGEAVYHTRELEKHRLNEEFNDGYNAAANICLELITKNIDELFSKINPNSSLSKQEQFLLLNLKELKSDTEEQLRNFSGNE